ASAVAEHASWCPACLRSATVRKEYLRKIKKTPPIRRNHNAKRDSAVAIRKTTFGFSYYSSVIAFSPLSWMPGVKCDHKDAIAAAILQAARKHKRKMEWKMHCLTNIVSVTVVMEQLINVDEI
ncbi:hypothetical protein M514_15867, partial [Trichuris suis]